MFQFLGMRSIPLLPLVAALALLGSPLARAQFVAFNDHAPGSGTSPNATTWDALGGAPGPSGPLKDISTGQTLPVTLAITLSGGGVVGAGTQGSPAPGTPLHGAFNGFVDFQGAPSPSIELTPGGLLSYTFSGLNPKKRYSFMGSAVRGNAPYTDRWTLFEIAGAADFTPAHTSRVLTTAQVPLISPSQAAINTGVNNDANSGDMAVWLNIDPGPEGSFSVTCQQYTGPVPDGSSAGSKGYGMTGIRLEEFDFALSPAAFASQPQSQTVSESQPVSFSVAVSGNPPPSLQWLKNDAAIDGATNDTYSIASAAAADDGAVFKVTASNVISNVVYSAVSSNAVLRVTADTTPPELLTAVPLSLGQIKLLFSERITPASASALANYSLTSPSGPVAIAAATLDPAQTSVTLDVDPLTENIAYTLSVSGIRDQSLAGNLIPAGSQKTFSAITYTPLSIGSPTPPGGIVAVPGGYDLRGGGADIAGNRDQFHFGYQLRSGDFDVRARLADLTITDSYVKAGLMVRESLQDNSRFAAVFASSAQLGSFFQSRSGTGSTAALTGPALQFPANYPWAWLRLRRAGVELTGFGSFDGNAWQRLGSINLSLPEQVFFGMAVTSGATNAIATAKFRDIGPAENPSSFDYVPAREALGPSNRRTGLIFSEIMYHAKPRPDGKSLDFIEIYNGEPIFADLTGWKVDGGVNFSFPDGFRLGAGQFAVIAADPAALQAAYGITGVLGPFQKNLSNSQDTLILRNTAGAVRCELTYSSQPPWPASADGAGHSLVCLKPSYGEEDPRAWGPSQRIGGSPGFDDPISPHPWAGVVINEFLAAPGPLEAAFIELFNAGNLAVDLSGCFLADSISSRNFRIPDGSQLAPRASLSFTAAQLGFALNASGGFLFLVAADESRILDAVRFGAQERAVSFGRSPDGAPDPRRLAGPTPGQPNAQWRPEPIVINELMYRPISGNDDDQFVELHNRSAAALDLGGWRFVDGIDFVFPAGTSIPAGGHLAVARNLQRLLTNHPHLTASTALGDFGGRLRNGGERVSLAKPGLTAGDFVVVSSVHYGTGGRWPELANRGGSSLELKDAHADLALPSNWAASDETQKSQWATYETTAPLNQANQTYAANKFYVMAQGPSEFLLDDLQIFRAGSTNILTNPGFESGQTGWTFYGTHRSSSVQASGAFAGNNCLHVRATEIGDEGPNSLRGLLTATIAANSTVTIRAKARWLSGWPESLLRIRGNGVELPMRLQVPANLGTPGLPNSRRIDNAGPAITEVTHFPPMPAANQSVLVTARISDPDGLRQSVLIYRLDPSAATSSIEMRDDGSGGDRLAGDGVFSATLPARASGLVAFRVQSQDSAATPATSLFPPEAPARECLIRWADPTPFGSLGHYHLWSTAASANDLTSRPAQERTYRDCSIIYGTRTIYNAGWRNKGSPFHSGVGSYSISFSDDELFLASDKHIFRATGNGGDEATKMAGDVSYWISEKLGLPFNHARYVRVYRNGALHYPLDYDLEVPDRSIARDWFGGGGLDDTLYKIAGWFEYDDNISGGTSSLVWAGFGKKPTSAPPYKTASYRYNWQSHPGGVTSNDYSLLFNLITAANASDKVTQLMNLADMEQWMRTFAYRRIVGDWDHWSLNTGQNMYMYAPLGARARLMSWDADFVLGLGQSAGDNNLFSAGQDPIVQSLFNVPTYRRMLWRAYQDAANGPLVKDTSDAQFNSRRAMLLKNNVSATAPTSLQSYVSARRTFLLGQLRTADAAAFSVATRDTTTSSPIVTVTGAAPFGVASIEINGAPYPITWTGNTAWSIKVPLGAASNPLDIVGRDLRGNVYTNATARVTITYTGAVPLPSDWVRINEIMYNAAATDAEYVEIFNRHPSYPFDLSGYRLKGADFTFPSGSFIQPNAYLLVVKHSAAFAAAYGSTIPIVGEYAGKLQNVGEALALVPPAAGSVPIDSVRYESVFPWPAVANGFGPSLQRVDAAQDSAPAGNWAATAINDANRATPGRANSNRAFLDPFPTLKVNEILASNQAGLADSSGERDPWIELFNSGTEPVDLSFCYLSNDPLNAALWQFPPGTALGPGQFLVVWADAQPEQSSETELHANFRLSPAGGVVALSRLQLGAPAAVDYAYYPAAAPDQSFGSILEGKSDNRRLLYLPTPGGPNNPGDMLLPVTINEWMASNVRSLTDPADGDFDDWFELHNSGPNLLDLGGYFLTDRATNATKFRIPSGYQIPSRGFLLVWADEEVSQNSPLRPDLHVNFKMAKAGDSVFLFTPNGAIVDSVTFGPQADNIAAGRYPDGAVSIFSLPSPTPRSPNAAPLGTRLVLLAFDGAQLSIGWPSTAGRSYQLESKTDLLQPAWSPLGGPVVASGPTHTVSIPVAPAATHFFRVTQLD